MYIKKYNIAHTKDAFYRLYGIYTPPFACARKQGYGEIVSWKECTKERNALIFQIHNISFTFIHLVILYLRDNSNIFVLLNNNVRIIIR